MYVKYYIYNIKLYICIKCYVCQICSWSAYTAKSTSELHEFLGGVHSKKAFIPDYKEKSLAFKAS